MPIKKVGKETPKSEKAKIALAIELFRRNAVKTPKGKPTTNAIKAAAIDNSKVAGMRSSNNVEIF